MFEPIAMWLEWKVQAMVIELMRMLANGLWFVEKSAGWIGDDMMSSTIWETLVTSMFDSVKTSMPDALRTILFGSGGGLFYLAIIAVGLILIMPQMVRSGNRPVELDRVLMWSIFVIALFISSTAGYDLIVTIETTRQRIPLMMAGNFNGGGTTLATLVSTPMLANPPDIDVMAKELPAAFANAYFPAPSAYTSEEIVFYDAPLIGANTSTIQIETAISLQTRRSLAVDGLQIAILNLIPAAIVISIVIALASLTASALVMLIFFVMGLPLGLFEFGQSLLMQIFRRYLLIWMLSILVGSFPAILINTAGVLLTPPVTTANLWTWITLLIVALIACAHIARLTFSVAANSFSLVGQVINAVAAPYADGIQQPQPRRTTPVGMGVAAAAMVGVPLMAAATGKWGAMAAGGAAAGAASHRAANRGSPDDMTTNAVAITNGNTFGNVFDEEIVEGQYRAVDENDQPIDGEGESTWITDNE